jgi:hypothetical protein
MPTHGSSSTLRSLQGRNAAARRWNHPDVEELSRDYAAEKLADFISKTVADFPPLTRSQRDRLARLLQGGDVA